MSEKNAASLPAKVYALVLADGTTEEVRTKKAAIAAGEASGQGFTVLSPRGFPVYEAPAAEGCGGCDNGDCCGACDCCGADEQEMTTIKVEKIEAGMTVVGTRRNEPIRVVGRVSVGRKHVTIFDQSGADFGWWPLGSKTQVVSQ